MSALSVTPGTPLPAADPAEVGFIPDRLAALGPAMQRYVDRGIVPNLVTLVARHGRIVHFEARGYMDLESRRPVDPETIYRLYSNSKPIAGVATMILFEEGLLTPDDPVSKFLPAFRNPVVRSAEQPGLNEPARREITIRDCLRHSSGVASAARVPVQYRALYREELARLGWLPVEGAGPAQTARERAEALARLPLSFHPGTAYEYHAGYILIGAIIEMISGKPLDAFYRERIFEPLGMHDTDWYLDESMLARFPACYRPERDGNSWRLGVSERAETSPKLRGPRTFFGAGGDDGGVLSTAGDYARFGQMLLNGGELDGVRILGRKTVEYMTSDHSEGIQMPGRGPGFGWGLGLAVRSSAAGLPVLRSVGSYGWAGAAGTQYLGDPKEGLLLVCFTQLMARQTMPGATYWEELERIAYQSLA